MRRYLYAALAFVVLFGLWWRMRAQDAKKDAGISAPVLAPNEARKIIIDQGRHAVTVASRSAGGNQVVERHFISPHGPTAVVEGTNGKITVQTRTYGTCLSPFVGAGIGLDFRPRVALGLNLFYIQRWEVGTGLAFSRAGLSDTRLFVNVAYNVYGNWLLTASIDNRQTPMLLGALRF